MSETSRCPQCGAELPQTQSGLCPACLLKLGLSGAIPSDPLRQLSPRPAQRHWPLLAAAALALIVIWAVVATVRRPDQPMPVVKLLLPPPDQSALGALAVSRDGHLIVFSAAQSEGKTQLWLRPLASLEAQPLSGTEGAAYPFWSPDSRSIGFFAAGKLRKIG